MKSQFYLLIMLLGYMFVSCQQANAGFARKTDAKESEEQASGYVFHDQNKNNKKDKGETGIEGVAVSNGMDVVHTDAKGYYALPVSEDAVIFVIKPRNWMTPVNTNNLPQFYYLHKPAGSPDNFKYQGVRPTGDLPSEINFPLYKNETSKEFKMVVFGDPQPYNIEQVDYFAADIVSELPGDNDLKFGMTMGDIVGDSLPLFSSVNQVVEKAGLPWYNVMGNHDINYQAPNDRLSAETFERFFGPSTYAFIYGDVHFIVLDDIIHHNKAGSRKYVGGLRPDQLKFVQNYLQTVPKDKLIVLSMHIPLTQHGKRFRQSDQKKLFELLKDFPHTLSISAHTHKQENKFFHKGSSHWTQNDPHHHFNVGTTSGSWWNGMRTETGIPHTMMRDGTPNGYALISFDGSDYIIDWKVAGSPEDHRMNIHVPQGITSGSNANPILSVNFFNGSDQSKVRYKIHGQTDWINMNKVEKVDPYYAKLDQRWKNLKKLNFREQWNNDPSLKDQPYPGTYLPHPDKSSHLWEATLSTDRPAGRYLIEVKVTGRYGRTFTEYQTMRIKPSDKE